VRAVIDTNVWISSLLNPDGAPTRILQASEQRRFVTVTSRPLLEELRVVGSRPRLRLKFDLRPADLDALLEFLTTTAELVPVTGTLQLCRDPKDDVVIETAFAGGAEAIVSRDEDLTRVPGLRQVLDSKGVLLWTVRDFLSRLNQV